jgi:mRNA-degrading endonuclease HigB of HigAB toxin-antitoxin module
MPSRRRSDSHPRRDPITEAIARRAFELFVARGQQHGHDLDDWLQAERELAKAAWSRPAAAKKSESS